MNDFISQVQGAHGALPMLVQEESPADTTTQSISGVGEAQGTLVAVGDGLVRKALLADRTLAREHAGMAVDDDDDDDDDEDEDVIFYDAREYPGELPDESNDQAAAVKLGQARPQTGIALDDVDGAISDDGMEFPGHRPDGSKDQALAARAGQAQEREADVALIQQQAERRSFVGRLSTWGMVAVGATLSAVGATFSAVGSVLQRPAPAVVEHMSADEAMPVAQAKTPREHNMAEARELATAVDEAFYKLSDQIYKVAGVSVTARDPDRLQGPELGVGDKLWRWKHAIQGGLAALQSTLGLMAVTPLAPVAAGMVSPLLGPVGGLALQSAAMTGAAYLSVKALRDFPSLASNHQVLGMIKETLESVQPHLDRLEELQAAERDRHNVEARMEMVAYARMHKLGGLRDAMATVSRSLDAAVLARDQGVRLGSGSVSRQLLGVAARTADAFRSFFSPVAAALGRIYAFLTAPADDSRRAARSQERADNESIVGTLRALRSSAQDSLVHKSPGLEVQAMQRATDAGASIDYAASRKQFIMGENLVRTLLSAAQPSFGVMAYDVGKEHGGVRAVSSTLTTARAIAWYLDAIADLPEDARLKTPGTPEVTRNPDGSLSVADPERRLVGFLMAAPVAYTAMMAGREGQVPSTGLAIDDPDPGMPGGTRGMQFESVLDEAGDAGALRLSFTAQSGNPVYLPLANERQMLYKMKVALHTASTIPPASGQDYSGWSVDRLEAHFQTLKQQFDREYDTFQADNQMLKAVDAWENPRLA